MSTLFPEVKPVQRQDWHLTSSGVAHQYRAPLGTQFPNASLQPRVNEPLPLSLLQPDQMTRYKMHTTTTGTFHDRKFVPQQLRQPFYEGLKYDRFHNIKDLSEKLGPGSWRRPLSMGYEKSETQDEFVARKGIREHYYFDDIFKNRPFLLNDHLQDGPTKYGSASTINPKLSGKIIDPTNMGILDMNEPYLTTYRIVHRPFTPQEKDFSKNASVDKEFLKNPIARTHQPMRDVVKFKFHTIIPPLSKTVIHVPHRGLLTEYQEIYQTPSDVKRSQDVYCPEDTPWALPEPSAKSIMSVPRFYTTEYQTIGKREMVPV